MLAVTIRRLIGLFGVVSVLTGAMVVSSQTAAVAEVPLPADDPFYDQPASLAGKAMGEVVDSRPVYIPDSLVSVPFSAWQVKYVSQDAKGTPWASMAVILRPDTSAASGVLLAYDMVIDAIAARCGPSYQLRLGAGEREAFTDVALPDISAALTRGWTVVLPDYLGPRGQFGVGYVEGRNTLDGIRAAENFGPSGLSGSATPVLMYGYSGGARGSEFAAELASDYAPELNIRGSAAGGLPVDMASLAREVNGGPVASIVLTAAFSFDNAYPELGIAAYFRDPELGPTVRSLCDTQLIARFAFTHVQDYTVGGVWPLDDPAIAALAQRLRAGRYGTPTAPLYLFSAVSDGPEIDGLVADYCARGVPVTFVKYPATDHVSTEFSGTPAAMDWLARQLTGTAEPPTCGAPGNGRLA